MPLGKRFYDGECHHELVEVKPHVLDDGEKPSPFVHSILFSDSEPDFFSQYSICQEPLSRFTLIFIKLWSVDVEESDREIKISFFPSDGDRVRVMHFNNKSSNVFGNLCVWTLNMRCQFSVGEFWKVCEVMSLH